MDNKCSTELRAAFEKEKIQWQLVPPHQHCENKSKRATQTFKTHFKSILATADPDFPIGE